MTVCDARIAACNRGPAYSSLIPGGTAMPSPGTHATRCCCAWLRSTCSAGRGFAERIDRGARRSDAAQQPVHLVVFPHDGLVESFDVRTAVILSGQDAVMLELDYSLLDGHTAESEF